MYYVYILQLKDKSYYHGFAADLKERIKDHENGIVSSTKNLRPFKLVFYAALGSKIKASKIIATLGIILICNLKAEGYIIDSYGKSRI